MGYRNNPKDHQKDHQKDEVRNETPSDKICWHKRLRQVEKQKKDGILQILVVCRYCRKAGIETYQNDANSQSVYVRKTFKWLEA